MNEQISDLNQLLRKYKSEIESLENQINEKKQKVNVVYEALKLLQQEGLVEYIRKEPYKTESISEKYKEVSINDAILDVLSNSDKYLSGQEIHEEIVKNGFESTSSDKKRDVYISLFRLEKKNKLIAKMIENRKKYMIAQTLDESRAEVTEPILPMKD